MGRLSARRALALSRFMFAGGESGIEEGKGWTPSRLGYRWSQLAGLSVHRSQCEELRRYGMFARDFVRISPAVFFIYIFLPIAILFIDLVPIRYLSRSQTLRTSEATRLSVPLDAPSSDRS
jgi:hypothetical protein